MFTLGCILSKHLLQSCLHHLLIVKFRFVDRTQQGQGPCGKLCVNGERVELCVSFELDGKCGRLQGCCETFWHRLLCIYHYCVHDATKILEQKGTKGFLLKDELRQTSFGPHQGHTYGRRCCWLWWRKWVTKIMKD